MPDERSAGVVLFREAGKARLYLLLHYEEGHWDFPKGHIEAGESEKEAAERECREETGISGIAFVPGFRERIGYTYLREGKPSSKEVYFLLASTSEAEVKLSYEHQGYAWLTCDEALSRLTFENARGVLGKAEGFLGRKEGLLLVPAAPGSAEFQKIWEICESSFPPDERRTKERQELLFRDPRYSLLAVSSEGRIIGFLSSWDLGGFTFIEHFAVEEGSRGRGLGRRTLGEFLKGKGKVILEVERPSSAARERRISFYEKEGFALNGSDYIQPPYGPGKRPVPMLLMSYPAPLGAKEFVSARARIHKEVYSLQAPLV